MTLEQLLTDARNVGRNGNGRQSSLEQRISQLEQAVAQLGQQPPAADQINPNYLTVTPQGIGAAFSGKINARGLVVPTTQSGSGDGTNEIAFTRQAPGDIGDGSTAGEILLFDTPAPHAVTQLFLIAERLIADGADAQVIANATNDTSSAQVMIIDAVGRSNFLQLPAIADLKAVFGVTVVTWPGGSNVSNVVAVGFGGAFTSAITALLLGTPVTSAGQACFANYETLALNSMDLIASDPFGAPANGVTAAISWLAVGS